MNRGGKLHTYTDYGDVLMILKIIMDWLHYEEGKQGEYRILVNRETMNIYVYV